LLKALRGIFTVQGGAAGVAIQDGRVTLLAGVEVEGVEVGAVAPDEDAIALADRAAAGHDERLACVAEALRSRRGGVHGS
jgi:hypothetical protein